MDVGENPRDLRISNAIGERAAARLSRTGITTYKTPDQRRTDPQKARRETVEWVKRLRDMCRLAETDAPGFFLPPRPHDFVDGAVVLEELYGMLVEERGDSALLYGEPGCGKSTLAFKFAWQTRVRSTR
jgi:hypothetical protein